MTTPFYYRDEQRRATVINGVVYPDGWPIPASAALRLRNRTPKCSPMPKRKLLLIYDDGVATLIRAA